MANEPIHDKDYNLVSVLYHALQGSETTTTYIRDAEQANDRELAEYFREAQEQYKRLADQAKKLLAQRIG